MNEGQYIALRNYAEEQSGLLRQLLAEQQRANELLRAIGLITDRADKRVKSIAEGPLPEGIVARDALTETRFAPVLPKDAVGPVTVETVKEEPLKTTETVQVVDKPAIPRREASKSK